MRIETDHYGFELPEESAAEIVASIDDETARDSILDAIEAADEGEAVRLTLGLADTLLHALSEWERAQEGGE